MFSRFVPRWSRLQRRYVSVLSKPNLPTVNKSVVFRGARDMRLETKPFPEIQGPNEAIIKVKAAGLCGTELHMYRGALKNIGTGQTMGHENLGEIVALSEDLTPEFKLGDDVLTTFTIQCGDCWFCDHGYTSKCPDATPFGTAIIDGGQAEYLRIPFAKSTMFHKPQLPAGIDDSVLILMADIFPTGYYGVHQIIRHFEGVQKPEELVILQLGCGPVGLCAIAAAKQLGIRHIFAVDEVPDRLERAKEFGAIPLNMNDDNVEAILNEATDGRGPDAVLEIVGSEQALAQAYKYVRRNGFIMSLGYHHGEIPITGLEAYMKNISIQFGRCPVKPHFQNALDIFTRVSPQFKDFIDTKVPLEDCAEAYRKFDKHEVRKVCFIPA